MYLIYINNIKYSNGNFIILNILFIIILDIIYFRVQKERLIHER